MIKELEHIEQERKHIHERLQKFTRSAIITGVVGGLLVVIGIILVLQSSAGANALFLIGGLIIFAGIIVNAIGQSLVKPYRNKFKTTVIEALLKNKYEEVQYLKNQTISLETVLSTGLVRKPDRWHGEDLVMSKYRGVHFEVSDMTLEERKARTDSKGNTYYYYEPYFKGRWFIFKFQRNFKDQIRIIEKSFLGWNIAPRGFKKVETESIEFNKKFQIESTSQEHAFYVITPVMIERIGMLEKGFRGTISLLFRNNELHIAINDNINRLEPKINIPLTDEGIQAYAADIDIMAEIIEAFGLDLIKYNQTVD